jgi:2-hydroxy-3-keto-5-methylthiopentenyl-1-phosphate phosphatase
MQTARLAIAFDFDDTLTPDSTSAFLAYKGIQPDEFWNNQVNPLLLDDWDPVPAYLYALLNESRRNTVISKEDLICFASTIQPYPGLCNLLDHLKEIVSEANPLSEIEYYIISSGIEEIIKNCSFANYFTDIWGSDFHYSADGSIEYPKKILSFTDKTRYLFQINKGLIGKTSRGKPFDVNKKVKQEQLRIPLRNIIYVGDGYTDIPCFSLLKQNEGFAIGVYDKHDRKKKDRAWEFVQDERVSNLLSADYSEGSDLCNSLEMAVRSVLGRIS